MALDQNAGKKKAVGIARNLFPSSPSNVIEIANAAVAAAEMPTPIMATPEKTTVAQALVNSPQKPAAGATAFATTARNLNRITKVSFMIDPELEKRFRKARLQSGFEKLEDAYCEAIKRFCEGSEKGQIDNF